MSTAVIGTQTGSLPVYLPGRLRSLPKLCCLGLTLMMVVSSTRWVRAQDDPLDAAFAALLKYDWGPGRDALAPIDVAIVLSHGKPEARRYLEDRLLSVLSGDAPRGAKDYACRKLGEIGTQHSVPALAALLGNAELSHMARGVLERIAGEQATRALGDALPQLEGDRKIGVINSLGRRGDPASVSDLLVQLKNDNPAVVRAAITALAAIDAPEAAEAVLAFRETADADQQEATVDACLRIAQRRLRQGELPAAANIFRALEGSKAEQIQCAVLLGLVRAEPAEARTQLMKSLASDNERLRRCAGEYVREHADAELAQELAGDMSELPAAGQLCLLDALSGRNLPAVRVAALQGLAHADAALRTTAAGALASCGEPADVELLVTHATSGEPLERAAAEAALLGLPGTAADAAILHSVDSASPEKQVILVRAIAARQIANSEPVLFQLAHAPDESVRIAAFAALETVADAALAAELVKSLAATRPGKEREAAQRAVFKACSQIADENQRVAPIVNELPGADAAKRAALLPALGLLGGATAREVVAAAMKDSDESVRDAAVRALCNWPDASVGDELLDLARNAQSSAHRIWAVRGFARVIVRQAKEKPEQTLAGLREAMQLATRAEDKRLILSRLTAVRVPDSLTLALSLLDDADLRADAVEASASLAEGMKDSHPKEARAALEQVLKCTQDPELQLYVSKLLWNMQLKGN